MEEAQIKQIIERQPLHGSALLDPRCKILLLVCIGFVSYFLAGEVVSLALMLVYGLFIALGNGGKWAVKMIVTYIIVAYLNALLRYVQVPVLSVIMSVFGVTVLKLIPIVMMGLWILRTTYMDDLMVDLYYEMKRENGYTDEQIMSKRRSLENVLSPLKADWSVDMMRTAGFRQVDMFWRCLNFCGWIAVK